ncbi:MAG: serine hydrolase domain-containing protein, partial [Jatrophihabitantaceae bacterium]
MVEIRGTVQDGYGAIADEFGRNFAARGEVGAAVAVYRDGVLVVDLWAGLRDQKRRLPWLRETTVPVFSTTKGVAALVIASLRAAGLLEHDAPVAQYWPEFAQRGKGKVTVRQLLAHEAGLAALDVPLRAADLMDLDALAPMLAAQAPHWMPGTRHGYHSISLGFYQNELVRRIDPSGRTIGQILAQDFAPPLGLNLHIGLPDDVDLDTVAGLGRLRPDALVRQLPGAPRSLLFALANRGSLTSRSLRNPGLGPPEHYTRRAVLRPEIASSNGVSDARSLARLYSAAATGDPLLPINAAALAELAQPAPDAGVDLVLRTPTAFALGFSKPT